MTEDTVFSGVHEVTIDLPSGVGEASGVVLKWRNRGDLLEGLVSREADGRVMTEWLPALLLSPVGEVEAVPKVDAG